MKKTILALLAIAAIAGSGYFAFAQQGSSDKVIAYYFHGSFRCPTCTNMEKYSREAIDTNFKDDISSGALEFRSVNVEEPDNEYYIERYQLYTKTLILSLVKDGKEVRSKNLDKIWEYAGDKKKFIDYVTRQTRSFLEEAK